MKLCGVLESYNGDVHIVRNFVLDNFCTHMHKFLYSIVMQYEFCLDLGIFYQYTYASVRCPQLLLNDLQDFYETLWSVRSHNGDVHIVRNFVLDNFCTKYERLDLGIFYQYTYASVRCPQLLLNDLQDFYETLWSVRII